MLNQHRRWVVLLAGVLLTYALYFTNNVLQSTEVLHHVEDLAAEYLGHLQPLKGEQDYPSNSWIPGHRDPYGLTALCEQTKWHPGVWLQCHNGCGSAGVSVCGGLNNARNRYQTCIRLAIDAGIGLILPSTTARNDDNLGDLNFQTVCPEHFWNIPHLHEALEKTCPQLKIRDCDDDTNVNVKIIGETRTEFDLAHSIGTFRQVVKNAFDANQISLDQVKESEPVIVSWRDAFNGWNYTHSEELSTIRRALFKVLRFDDRLLDLGTRILRSPILRKEPFYAVHLRAEADWNPPRETKEDQKRFYIADALRISSKTSTKIKTMYVSCGDREEIEKFRDEARPHGLTVVDKWSILEDEPELIEEIEALGFDQKAIVEYRVLVNAAYFMGPFSSTLSELIAFARTVNDEEDFFNTYVFPGSERTGYITRHFGDVAQVKGNKHTKMVLPDSGFNILDAFP